MANTGQIPHHRQSHRCCRRRADDIVSFPQGLLTHGVGADLRKNHICGNRPTHLLFYRLTSLVFELFSALGETVAIANNANEKMYHNLKPYVLHLDIEI